MLFFLFLFILLKERGKELKVPHHASAAAVRDSNLPHVMATCHTWRQYASYGDHLPLFLTIGEQNIIKGKRLKGYLKAYIGFLTNITKD